MGGQSRTVLIVDDHPVVRTGVRKLIEALPNFEIIGEAKNGREAVAMATRLAPNIVVLDLSMPEVGGMEALEELRRRLPGIEVLVFTLHRSEQIYLQATGAGARAFVCKEDSDHLVGALQALARGEAYVSPAVSVNFSHESKDEVWDHRALTAREQQVVRLVALGKSNKVISRMLGISVKTTETHRASAMRKTGSRSASSLTIYAAQNGLVDL